MTEVGMPSSSANLIRAALDENAKKAQDAAEGDRPDLAEQYSAASLKLSQALATLLNAER